MEKIIGVRFKKTGKLTLYDPLEFSFKLGDNVIVSTERGEEVGRVVKILNKEEVSKETKLEKIIKPATNQDMQTVKENKEKANEALEYCKEEVKRLKLNMKVLLAEYTFDALKLTIYFAAVERVDFRELVRLIASKYRARIELRQIGPRDEIKAYPNLGMCGKEVCCRTYLQDFEPVTIRMAKDQGLQINMSKLSGACGKLMCCLKYEEQAYRENLKLLPRVGDLVTVIGEPEKGKVTNINILNLKIKVRYGHTREDERYETYTNDEVMWDGKEEQLKKLQAENKDE